MPVRGAAVSRCTSSRVSLSTSWLQTSTLDSCAQRRLMSSTSTA
jgi:hypothetical protein